MTDQQKQGIRKIVSTYFKDSKGNPYKLTDGQCEVFAGIIHKGTHWLWVSAPTRYGKTEVSALALIYLAVFHQLKIPVVAGSEDKAEKIMEYVIQHIGDHPELHQGLINLKGISDVEKLKIKASKQALRWSHGGWIYITSVDSRSISKEGEKAVGEGGDVVFLEEAGLIRRKEQFSKIIRMAEGEWRKLIMSGNCVEKSVFETAFNNPMYKKVRIGMDQATKEGRYTEQELEEKKSQTTTKDWKRYYLVEFPKAGEFSYFKPKSYEYLPNELEYFGSLDPALGESKKGSLTGIVILGKDKNGQFYEVESIGEKLKPEETIKRILNMPYKFNRFGIEAVQFQRYFLHTINQESKLQGKYIPFDGINTKGKKEERIESMEPTINTGQVLFKQDSILWNHMQDYPETENLDVLDALEMAMKTCGVLGQGEADFAFV